MRFAMACVGLLILAIASNNAFGQQISVYKWVDEHGVPHYTDLPPEGASVEETNITFRRTDEQAVQARVDEQTDLLEAVNTRKTQEREVAQENKQQFEELEKQRADNCRQARERKQTYDTAHRLYRPTADGGQEFLDSDEVDAARAESASAVREWCG